MLTLLAQFGVSPSAKAKQVSRRDGQPMCLEADAPISAQVIRTHYDPFMQKLSWIRVHSGTLRKDIEVAISSSRKSMKLGHRANLMAIVGEIRLRAGDEAGAYEAFAKAVEMNPDHVDARRRIRLRDMRQAKAEPQKGRGLSSLRGLFSFGKKGGGDPGAGESGG